MGGGVIKGITKINKHVLKEFQKLPNYYSCIDSECKLIPEILKINYEKNTIKLKCPVHDENSINIKDYLEKDNKNIIYNNKCENKHMGEKEIYFCLKCNKTICQSCLGNHEHKKSDIIKIRFFFYEFLIQ